MEKLELTNEEFREISWVLFLCKTIVEERVSEADKQGWEAKLPREWLLKVKRTIRLLYGDKR